MWRFNNIPSHLPQAQGPYTPGCMDVMIDYSASGLFMRLYYPTKAMQNDSKKWQQWCGDEDYLNGTAKAIYLLPIALRLAKRWYAGGDVRIPALYGEKVNVDKKLKCIIFSHGYASNRFFYSIICNELASRGYLVAVIEHRDQTACYTYYYKSKEDAENNIRTTINVKHVKFGKGHYEERNKQVHQRSNECCKLLDFLIDLNNGTVPHNVANDVKTNGEINFKLNDLVGRIDLQNLTIVGHSFGGATALLTLSKRKELKQGIILDGWMFPLKSEENLPSKIAQPLLFVNTQTFHIRANIKLLEKYLTNDDREMYTILHTTHESQTDSACVMGYWLNWFMKKLHPATGLKINNALMLRFLNKYVGNAESIEDCEVYLANESANIVSGLTQPWA